MRTFVISDIHGGYLALLQVLTNSNFDYEEDELIVLGDVCDGWPEIRECFYELLKIKKLTYIIGNHDAWALEYYTNPIKYTRKISTAWYEQGGHATLEAFGEDLDSDILDLLINAKVYYEYNNMLFVHAGFSLIHGVKDTPINELYWDRTLASYLFGKQLPIEIMNRALSRFKYSKIFIGHTPTINFTNSFEIMKELNVILIDTGASYNGPISLIDINTEEVWQSDPVHLLYPGITARGHKFNNK